ncbi:UNVERIFIED_CONTAM: E3 ubiquitin-protein ligase UPL1 [Sesamum radiatum]|uniref:E3 ubiquitin-protein ligase UPL1 n=1 Tax=Sesamum radiatum TaxID=300843 RepID=A0AAW2KH43_SESRA
MGTRDRNAIDSQLLRQLQDPLLRMVSLLTGLLWSWKFLHPYEGDGCDISLEPDSQSSSHAHLVSESDMPDPGTHPSSVPESDDVDMSITEVERDQTGPQLPLSENLEEPLPQQNSLAGQEAGQTMKVGSCFTQARSAPAPTYAPPTVEDIDPEFLAALPPDIQAEVLAQQRAQRIAQQSEGQPVDMDNASIIATFPAELREEVLLTSSEALLSALPSPLLAEAQMLRDRAMSHYHARSLFGSSQRLNSRGNRLGFDRQTVMDRGVGVTIGRRASSIAENLKLKELEGEPLFGC